MTIDGSTEASSPIMGSVMNCYVRMLQAQVCLVERFLGGPVPPLYMSFLCVGWWFRGFVRGRKFIYSITRGV